MNQHKLNINDYMNQLLQKNDPQSNYEKELQYLVIYKQDDLKKQKEQILEKYCVFNATQSWSICYLAVVYIKDLDFVKFLYKLEYPLHQDILEMQPGEQQTKIQQFVEKELSMQPKTCLDTTTPAVTQTYVIKQLDGGIIKNDRPKDDEGKTTIFTADFFN